MGRQEDYTPSNPLWLSILKLGKSSGTIHWRVKSRTVAGAMLTSDTWSLQLAAPQAATVTAPADGQVFAADAPPPTLAWEANHNAAYKVVFSTRADLGGTLKVASGDTYTLRGTSWTLPAAAWSKIRSVLAPRNADGTVYYAVLAKDAIGRKTSSPVRSLKVLP